MAINWNAPIEVRDGRNGNWFWVDKAIWSDERLTASDKVLYGTLAYFANQKNQSSTPSIEILQSNSGLSRRQAYRSIKRLEEFMHVSITRTYGKPNKYTLLDNGINHLKEERGAKLAPVPNITQGGAKSTLKGVPNNTTNKNIYKENNKEIVINNYGKPEINKILDYMKLKFELPRLDGSVDINRRYAWTLFKASRKGLEGVKWLIDQAADDRWFKNHITSTKDLWANQVKIISTKRNGTIYVEN